ncbi:hypothetical protein J1N35_041984 [Gossypium stocksii]|uniref:Uncharacterized protein n=1 Tax=Gossypium stocksii TaxID=47602 RepID=A0A9D3ZJZ0_9ROSI|nr:hypothetical protein J1N35_041984 [Gossypium stocksii]
MSIFGSLSNPISPDYFGDEFGLPLPQYSTSEKNKAAKTTMEIKPTIQLGNPPAVTTNSRQAIHKELKNGFVNRTKMAESREVRRGEPALAPMFDGLLCFETFVFTNFK